MFKTYSVGSFFMYKWLYMYEYIHVYMYVCGLILFSKHFMMNRNDVCYIDINVDGLKDLLTYNL